MKLSELLKSTDAEVLSGWDTEISGIAINSAQVKPGDLFIAYKGYTTDSHRYIGEALERGAVAVCVEEVPETLPEGIAVARSQNVRKLFGPLSARFYDYPAEKLKIIAVTGTKGKTTTTEMIRSILEEAGYKTGTIGTLGAFYDGEFRETTNTTPDGLELNRIFADMVDSGVEYVIMEASSQGFKLGRMDGLTFDAGVLLNISPDHIGKNEHEDFQDYLFSKLKILDQSRKVFANVKDPVYGYIPEEWKKKVMTFAPGEPGADYYSVGFQAISEDEIPGSIFEVRGDFNSFVRLNIPGRFNCTNALASLAVCTGLGISEDAIKRGLAKVRIPGRGQLIRGDNGKTVYLDFAHNWLSVSSLLRDLREYRPGRIINVFGLDHNETVARRREMGLASGEGADLSILTTGTLPSDMDFYDINKDVIRGLEESGGQYIVIKDRKKALEYAVSMTGNDDILVLMNLETQSHGRELPEIDYLKELLAN